MSGSANMACEAGRPCSTRALTPATRRTMAARYASSLQAVVGGGCSGQPCGVSGGGAAVLGACSELEACRPAHPRLCAALMLPKHTLLGQQPERVSLLQVATHPAPDQGFTCCQQHHHPLARPHHTHHTHRYTRCTVTPLAGVRLISRAEFVPAARQCSCSCATLGEVGVWGRGEDGCRFGRWAVDGNGPRGGLSRSYSTQASRGAGAQRRCRTTTVGRYTGDWQARAGCCSRVRPTHHLCWMKGKGLLPDSR